MSKMAKFCMSAAVTLALALPAAAADVTAETVVATVNGKNITMGDLLVVKEGLPAQYQQLPDDVLMNGLIEQLVQQTVLADSVEGKLTKREEIGLGATERAFLAGTALERVAATAVTEDAVKAAYDEQYAKVEPGKEYHARHILVPTEDEAKAVEKAIADRGDFATVANEKTQDPSGKTNGGDLGWFGAGMMVPEFEEAVAGLQPGQVSQPIQTQFGWHVIKLEEVRDAAVPTLDEVRPQIETQLQQAAVQAELAKATESAKIERTEGIDPSVLRNQTLLNE
ncbi:peptidylprolyl isomerase [Haematobacter massiliensis]|uniref:Parvulin-like PPIase n=1 Tax=Haematobacter massiliensis TaxID=195105 RepID=A0A086Y8L2_9RHOB|nr:peptidylprolyl isomerase [Haematobacter massiliensis]KFI30612.1 peptidylprolyl isomerase [Haematobacter massiliensis]OWJ71503.1 peptidylprolyl isomerase [Haematobacter massiliensis]OWJ87196.1 peptidylprolyl isomerase [Haematobacter massiliensis]QBJ25082.1 peptidylprolyl isomerase [Haematobacter massiliensis]